MSARVDLSISQAREAVGLVGISRTLIAGQQSSTQSKHPRCVSPGCLFTALQKPTTTSGSEMLCPVPTGTTSDEVAAIQAYATYVRRSSRGISQKRARESAQRPKVSGETNRDLPSLRRGSAQKASPNDAYNAHSCLSIPAGRFHSAKTLAAACAHVVSGTEIAWAGCRPGSGLKRPDAWAQAAGDAERVRGRAVIVGTRRTSCAWAMATAEDVYGRARAKDVQSTSKYYEGERCGGDVSHSSRYAGTPNISYEHCCMLLFLRQALPVTSIFGVAGTVSGDVRYRDEKPRRNMSVVEYKQSQLGHKLERWSRICPAGLLLLALRWTLGRAAGAVQANPITRQASPLPGQ
jgi:hypothetical protein